MGKSPQTFSKKEREKKKRKKKQDKIERREQRKQEKAERGKLSFEDQLSYVDEYGNLSSTPPDPSKKKKRTDSKSINPDASVDKQTDRDKTHTGFVRDFLFDKGYGFIKDADSKDSIFVHINDAYDSIQIDDKVSFQIKKSPKGVKATNVRLSNPKEQA